MLCRTATTEQWIAKTGPGLCCGMLATLVEWEWARLALCTSLSARSIEMSRLGRFVVGLPTQFGLTSRL